MKIAVTGATGGLGRSLTEFLLARGIEVVAQGRNEQIGRELGINGASFHACEITDIAALTKAFAECTAVVHCAGFASPWAPWEKFEVANVKGTAAVLRAAENVSLSRFIHISTPSLYFAGQPRENVRETDDLPTPKTFYSRSKLLADQLVIKETRTRGLDSVLIRPRGIFGPYDRTILPRFLRTMKKGIFPLPRHGQARLDFTAVENVVEALWLALQAKEPFRAEIFNITNDEPIAIRDWVLKIARAFDQDVRLVPIPMPILKGLAKIAEFRAEYISHREPLLNEHMLESIGVTQTLSIEKAKRVLGYRPLISLDEALNAAARAEKATSTMD